VPCPRRGLVRRSCPARFRLASDDNWIVKIGSLNLQRCQFERHRRAKGEPKGNGHAAAVAVSHLLIASARELRRVRRDTRYSFIGGNWGVFAIEVYWTGNPGSRGSASHLPLATRETKIRDRSKRSTGQTRRSALYKLSRVSRKSGAAKAGALRRKAKEQKLELSPMLA
jgi:hypothetical protein